MSKPFNLSAHLSDREINGYRLAENAAWDAICSEPMTSDRAERLGACAIIARDMLSQRYVEKATYELEDQ